MYEKGDVDEAIDCAVEEHGGVPTFTEYRKMDIDPHPSQPVFDRFYSGWNNAVWQNGYEPRSWHGIPDEVVQREFESFLEELDQSPTKKQAREELSFSPELLINRFDVDTWNDLLEEFDLETRQSKRKATRDEYIEELRDWWEDGKTNVDWSEHLVEETDLGRDGWYDSWDDLLSEVGADAMARHNVTKGDLREMWNETAEQLGRCPQEQEIEEAHNISSSLIQKYGGWETLSEEFGYDPMEARSVWTPEECIEAYERVQEEIGHHPTKAEYSENRYEDEPGIWIFPNFWESWSAFKQDRGYTPDICETVTPEDCLAAVAEYLEQTEDPTIEDYTEWRRAHDEPRPSHPAINRKTDGWTSLLKELGEHPNRQNEYSYEAYERAFDRIQAETDHSPPRARDAFSVNTRPSPIKMIREFGSWNEVLLEFHGEIRFDPETVNGDYGDGGHYYGPDWYQIRPEIRELDDHECQKCGMTSEEHHDEYESKLHVHHIRPFRFFDTHEEANRQENLVSLCYQCHRQLEVYAAEEDVESQIEQLDGDRWKVTL